MAEDMSNGTEPSRTYQDAMQAALSERVTNMGRRINDVEVEMRAGFNQLGNSLSAATNETRASIAGLSTSMADRARPQWQALSVMLAVVVVLGGLVYWPIREATGDLKTSVQLIAEKMVSREEIDWRSARGAEDRATSNAAINELRSTSLPRSVWEERNHARDGEIAELSRRINELRSDFGAIYGTRDVILDLKKEVDNLRFRAAQSSAP